MIEQTGVIDFDSSPEFHFLCPGDGRRIELKCGDDGRVHWQMVAVERAWSPQECRDFAMAVANIGELRKRIYGKAFDTPESMPQDMTCAIKTLNVLGDAACKMAESANGLHKNALQAWEEVWQMFDHLNNKVCRASLWARIKYVFTGRI